MRFIIWAFPLIEAGRLYAPPIAVEARKGFRRRLVSAMILNGYSPDKNIFGMLNDSETSVMRADSKRP